MNSVRVVNMTTRIGLHPCEVTWPQYNLRWVDSWRDETVRAPATVEQCSRPWSQIFRLKSQAPVVTIIRILRI